MADEIMTTADPGEYGLEDYWCRAACCFLFMAAMMSDLYMTFADIMVLYHIPNEEEQWIEYKDLGKDKDQVKEEEDMTELDLIDFKLSGMSLFWKCETLVTIIMPKLLIWVGLALSGFTFLMETAGILDLIINAMALTFILQIDELMYECCTTSATHYIMDNLSDLPLDDADREEQETEEQVLDRFVQEELESWKPFLAKIIPWRFMTIVSLQLFFMWAYYVKNCHKTEAGNWVSNEMRLPVDLSFRPLERIFGFSPEAEEKPFWRMPEI
eukprot:TRINITY_DN115032_c0_g1_i1.p1 TRINITY_DN115032_c0_g1~~TRINITY_DN115032_c0_g1_i1.p1  ORF type:complete len:287 (+),score=51.56 TRINITY_DN115032_c0_g1_i1:54-863(+)